MFFFNRESSLADILEGIPPTFSKKPKACVAPVGSTVDLEVRLVAVPEPEIKWYYKGKPVSPTATKMVITTSDMHSYASTLTLKNVSLDEEGAYTIVAKNREGEASLDITLKVKQVSIMEGLVGKSSLGSQRNGGFCPRLRQHV